jgi:hypothetical protein
MTTITPLARFMSFRFLWEFVHKRDYGYQSVSAMGDHSPSDQDQRVKSLCMEWNSKLTRDVERSQLFRTYREIGFIRNLEQTCLTNYGCIVFARFTLVELLPSVICPAHNALVYDIPCIKGGNDNTLVTSIVASNNNGLCVVQLHPSCRGLEGRIRQLSGLTVEDLQTLARSWTMVSPSSEPIEFCYPGRRFHEDEKYRKTVEIYSTN